MSINSTISLSRETKRKLAMKGSKGESFNQILIRLLEKFETSKQDEMR